MQPKYSQLEIERRWLVTGPIVDLIRDAPWSDIEDRYLTDTRMRLRKVVSQDESTQWKLCKKYGKLNELSEPIVNIYLSEFEYAAFSGMPAAVIRKRRYRIAEGSIDVYGAPSNLVIFEVEFESESHARNFKLPAFASTEITNDEAYSGAALALGISPK